MNSALINRNFRKKNRIKRSSEVFTFPKGEACVYVSTLFELGDSDSPHYHDEPHLAFIVNGGLLDKRQKSERERFGGELTFFRAGEIHRTITTIFPTKYVSLQFQSDYFRRNPAIETSLAEAEKNPAAKFDMLRIYKELAANDEYSASSLEMLLNGLLAAETAVGKSRPTWLNRVAEILNDRWNDEISLDDLAVVAGVHPKTISKYFPRFFNCTLGEYRRSVKIEKSLALIKNSNLSLTEIACECGFYDQSHFISAFKNLTGFRPKQFRKF